MEDQEKNVKRVCQAGVFFLLAILTLASFAQAEIFSGKVVGILDGDTIEVMHGGKPERVRLNGIDCPEKGQAFGTRAREFTSDLAFGQYVMVEAMGYDRYGRTIGEVIPDGRTLNRELVKAGLAWWYQRYSEDESLGRLEAEARAAKRGLWTEPNPIPPWQFRSEARGTTAPRVEPQKQQAPEVIVYITSITWKDALIWQKARSLKHAKARGYEPCKVCKPPQ